MSDFSSQSASLNRNQVDVPLPVRVISAIDLLICMANIGLFAWTIYKLYVEGHIDYIGYSMFANMVIVTSGLIGLFGVLGNILIQGGMVSGVRFGWWRIGVTIGSIAVFSGLMYMLLPNPDQLLSVKNRETYLIFGGSSVARLVWVSIYGVALILLNRAASRKKQ